ncbi:DNA repair protein xp-E, putative [Entamoeba dispar SAW760]|uniref:DNA repair protein xp-E, putative n=1 Tax=Entamoeba dispar (strain ATCC PRA-260 / SAW760) TaxID=370354 RepID=B0ETM9_ENTDS|nr:DNA repair protein xp-E, putative [Entamoeba dispar SAW760]EDR22214.1 DNA repair protein xp-E, putative [Entamoeba dispar SAW760]|eukprot:EDR22214.1 DNA repair protein xp-E, putative [Entamoeba dispar SAW760]
MNQDNDHFFMFNTLINPSGVSHSITAQLNLNINYLVVSKLNLLELYEINSTGLIPLTTKRYSSGISLLLKYKPLKDITDYLIIVTQSNEIEILKLTTSALHIISSGSLKDTFGRKAFFGVKAAISPNNQILLLNLYEQLIKVVLLPQYPKDQLTASNIKVNHSHILDMTFCLLNDSYQLALLHENKRDIRHIDTYTLNSFNELEKGSFNQPNVGSNTSRILGFKDGIIGIFVISDETGCYFNGNGKHILCNLNQYPNTACCFIKKDVLIMTDSKRNLDTLEFKVNISNEIIEVTKKQAPKLLQSISSTISDLSNQILFIGSLNGDNLIMNLNGKILEKWSNFGSLMDARQISNREDYLVAGNGGGKGSIGLMIKGSGIEELGACEIDGIKSIESIEYNSKKYVIVGFEEESNIWEIHQKSKHIKIEESLLKKIIGKERVICCGIIKERLIFVCKKGIYSIDKHQKKNTLMKFDSFITHAKFINQQIYFIYGTELFKINEELKIQKMKDLEQNVSCFDANEIIVIGLWDGSILIFDINGVLKKTEVVDTIGRSVLIDNNKIYVGCDNEIIIFLYHQMEEDCKYKNKLKYQVEASQSVKLKKLYSIPCVVANKTFTFQQTGLVPLAVEDLIDICESPVGAYGIICATKRGIVFGLMKEMSRVTFKMIHSGENCCKIATDGSRGLIVGKTIKSINLVDGSFGVTTVELKSNELALCVDSLEDNIYAVGTAIIRENEIEPSSGRILLIRQDSEGLIYIVGTEDYDGAVYCLKKYQKGIVAFINRNVHVIEKKGKDLSTKQNMLLPLIGVSLDICKDYIIAGDLARSVSVYRYRNDIEHLDIVGKDNQIVWSSCVGSIESEYGTSFLVADVSGNIKIFNSNEEEPKTDDEKINLISQVHIADSINFIQKSFYKGCLMGGVHGGIYNICEISKEQYLFLDKIQSKLVKPNWRESVNTQQTNPMMNCIDGDKIESVLEWSEKKQILLAQKIGVEYQEMIEKIQSLFSLVFN